MMVQSPVMSIVLAQQSIVPDGRTQTTVQTNGSVTDVHTSTINGANAYNSFSRFNVPTATTTNLHVPNAANNLINLVHNERSEINGILNSYKNGQIGGNVYFLNPHGIMVGQSGVVNVGALTMMTPTKQYVDSLINEHGGIDIVRETELFSGNVPLSNTGVISVKGKINAIDKIQLSANDVNIDSGASLRAGRQVQVKFGDIVNTNGINTGNEIVVSSNGSIKIVASNNVNIAGEASTDSIAEHQAGEIDIKAGNDINVNNGAVISAKGEGENSDGGQIIIFADRNSLLENGAKIDVSAQNGKGGFLEFSAKDTVNIFGNGLISSAGGTVLIDPTVIIWKNELDYATELLNGTQYNNQNVFTNGANFTLLGNSITIRGLTISTRNIKGVDTVENHLSSTGNGESGGNSGNISIQGQSITLDNAKLLAFATGTYEAGSIEIKSESNILDGIILRVDNKIELKRGSLIKAWSGNIGDKAGNVTITLEDNGWTTKYDKLGNSNLTFTMDENSKIYGKDVSIKVLSVSGTSVETEDGSEDYASIAVDLLDKLNEKFEIDKNVNSILDIVSVEYNRTHATINIDGTIKASGSVNIKAQAESHAELKSDIFGFGIGVVGANAEININQNAFINAQGTQETDTGVTIESIVKTVLGIESKSLDIKKPVDFAAVVGMANSSNTLNIKTGAQIISAKDITASATTERSQSVSASLKNTKDKALGLTAGVLVGNSDTKVNINGILEADGSINLSAKTNTTKNSISAETALTEDKKTGGDQDKTIIDSITKKFKNLFSTASTKIEAANSQLDDSNDPFSRLAASISVAVLVDNVTTNININVGSETNPVNAESPASLISGGSIAVKSETVNTLTATASSEIGQWKEGVELGAGGDVGIVLSVPVIVMNNSAKTIIGDGTVLQAADSVSITADTKIPRPDKDLLHLLADDGILNGDDLSAIGGQLLTKVQEVKNSVDEEKNKEDNDKETGEIIKEKSLDALKTDYKKFFNTLTVAATDNDNNPTTDHVDPDNLAVSVMASLQFINNTAVSQVGNAVITTGKKLADVDKKTEADKLTVKASSDIELANAVGDVFNFWGTESGKSAYGGALLLSNNSNTTIARIDGGNINAGAVEVNADSKMIEFALTVSGNKAGDGNSGISTGLNLMGGYTDFDSYTLAKIDDAVTVTANSVSIKADDDAYRIGVVGGLTSGTQGIGLSTIITVLDREAHAVWGNLLDRDGNPVTIKGDGNEETVASSVIDVDSVVSGDVDITATLGGWNVTAALAGVAGEQEQARADKDNQLVNGKEYRKGQLLPYDVNWGFAGAVNVNVLHENVSAGISGNVKIDAQDIGIKASNSIIDIALAGGFDSAVVYDQVDEKSNGEPTTPQEHPRTGIAGAISVNLLDGDTLAYLQPKTNTENNEIKFDSLIVNAERAGQIWSASIGESGFSVRADKYAYKNNTTGKYWDGEGYNSASAIWFGEDSQQLPTDILGASKETKEGGAFSEGSSAAFSFSWNEMKDDTLTRVVNAYLDDKTSGDITIGAKNSSLVAAIGGGLSFAKHEGKESAEEGFSAGISIGINGLNNDTTTIISDSVINANKLTDFAVSESLIVSVAIGAVKDKTVRETTLTSVALLL